MMNSHQIDTCIFTVPHSQMRTCGIKFCFYIPSPSHVHVSRYSLIICCTFYVQFHIVCRPSVKRSTYEPLTKLSQLASGNNHVSSCLFTYSFEYFLMLENDY